MTAPAPSPMLRAALGYGRAGLRIFPILELTKDTPLIKQWGIRASCDANQITIWWTRWPNANIGLACGPSGIGVVDSDVKPGGTGEQTLAELEVFEGKALSLTRMQRTPSGGIHRLYRGVLATTAGKLGKYLDTRGVGSGNGGYILLPPSRTKIGVYEWTNKEKIAPLDAWVGEACGDRADSGPAPQDPLIELDLPGNVEWARHWLANDAPVSKEGAGGDDTLVKRVVPILKDHGISEETAGELMAEVWNGRCEPPWQLGDCADKDNLFVKVHNGYLYCRDRQPGVDAPQAEFVDPAEPLTGEAAEQAAEGERQQAAEKAAGRETWESIKKGWVYVGQQKMFVRRSDGRMWDVDAFEKQFGYVKLGMTDAMGRAPQSLTKAIFSCRPGAGLKTFDTFCYAPGQGEDHEGAFNQWRRSEIEPAKGDTSLWDAHLEYLFADEAARNRVLNWIAWVYQNPTLHPNHALMVHGEYQGTGKSLVPQILAKLLSSTPATPLSQHTLELDHNAWALRTRLAICEVRAANKKLTDILHDLITGPTVHVDMKNVHDFDIPNVLALYLETNKADAMSGMDNSDRRYEIESTDQKNKPLKPREQSYYHKLYGVNGVGGLIRDKAALAAIAYALKHRGLKGYSGEGRAPATVAKKQMMVASADDLEKWMIEYRDDPPLNRSLVSIDEIIGAMPEDLRHTKGIRQRIASVLKGPEFRGEQLGKVRLGGRNDPQPHLWAINKTRPDVSVRETFKDATLAKVYRAERRTPTPNDIEAMERAAERAREDFAGERP